MDQLKKRLAQAQTQIHAAAKKARLEELETEVSALRAEIPHLDWGSDRKHAEDVTKKEAELERRIKPWRTLVDDIDMAVELSADPSFKSDLESQTAKIEKEFDSLKKELRFSGAYDDHDVILSIYAGAGGTDAQDWAQMLMRMYVRWAESQGLNVKTIDQSDGEEAGIKSVTLELTGGTYLYGKLQGEHGVHRLVRLSPFNADHLRQTSFAKVEILPLIDKPDEVDIDEKDLKIDVFRAGGHGGQSVNTTDSAVRVTHLPTGISVSIQNERSQLKNKETALNILRSKIVQLATEQHAKNLSELKGPNQSAEWGNQIRNYVLHPYKQVKDTRSGYESTEVEKVLNGHLEPLIDAWLEN